MDLTSLKFYYMEGDGSSVTDKIGSDVKQALEKAKAYIKSTYNVEVQEVCNENNSYYFRKYRACIGLVYTH